MSKSWRPELRFTRSALMCLVRYGVAGVFLVAAMAKLLDTEGLLQAIRQFGWLPESLVRPAGLLLLAAELTLGGLLLSGRAVRATGLAAALLATGFAVVTAVKLAQGVSQECHCFGVFLNLRPPAMLTVDLLLLLACLALVAVPPVGSATTRFEWLMRRVPRDGLGYLQLAVWALVGIQVATLSVSVWSEMQERGYYLERWQALQRSGQSHLAYRPTPKNRGLKLGLRVPSLPVLDGNGARVDLLRQGTTRQAILFVSSCTPCASGLVNLYQELWRKGLPIQVVAASPVNEIAGARRTSKWELPIYSDYGLPQAAANCRIVYRPAVFVVDHERRVIYAPEEGDDVGVVASSIEQVLLGRSQLR